MEFTAGQEFIWHNGVKIRILKTTNIGVRYLFLNRREIYPDARITNEEQVELKDVLIEALAMGQLKRIGPLRTNRDFINAQKEKKNA